MESGLACGASARRISWCRRLFFAVAAAAVSAAATAQALISPVVVEFVPRQKVATVRLTLSDKVTRPMRLQAQLLRWRQDIHGAALTEPSEDLVVTPRIADLKPGQQQVLRVALRGSLPGDAEMAYRLVLEDVAEPARMDMGGGAEVHFRMAYDLPVLVPPRGPVLKALRWKSCPSAGLPPGGGICVRVVNAGNRRVKVQSLTVSGDGWQQSVHLKEGENVLAGDEREWKVPAQGAGPLRAVQVRTVQGEVLEALPAGG